MKYSLKNQLIENFDLKDQKVFIRADLNVPIFQGKVSNSYRIECALPTIRYALDQGARVILASHLGRPKGIEPELSLAPVAEKLSEILDVDVYFMEELVSDAPQVIAPLLKKNGLILLENLRFHPGEQQNDSKIAQQLAQDIDIYINDAFGVCHRKHMSLSALPQQMNRKGYGFLIQREFEFLNQIKSHSKNPFVTVLGGSKVKDKFDLILNLLDRSDKLVVGGAMAYVFLKAQGYATGDTPVEIEAVHLAQDIIKRMKWRKKELFLPWDHLIVPEIQKTNACRVTSDAHIPKGWKAVDIGPQTIEQFSKAFDSAKTIFWNGPMGLFEIENYSQGTRQIAQAIGKQDAFCVVGGGDSARAVLQYGYESHFDHVSTGGGASLAYIQDRPLPGIKSLVLRRTQEAQV